MSPHPQVAPCGVGFHCIIHHQTTARTANTNSACGRTSAHRGSRARIGVDFDHACSEERLSRRLCCPMIKVW
ncbi:lignin expressed protein 13 [Heterobasidion irregulare TC 32-1]|uniref:Lignin expressed protein 13 n=1 Tax=Heterobasidion irregulare (strain TC 32-1) TaxID=747525 RepID=W4K250_HETIT|nr:lignin expressed protein 13 [Heterobasidion irregulare TC 32-1]ETW79877.1 lignin expressed protein 13 [Heterobasidion irregulare TC 32-1]